MDPLSILVLGVVQGITEWLPVSSKTIDSFIYLKFFNGDPNLVLYVLLYLHLGTLLAAAIYFRKQIIELTKGGWAFVFSRGKETGSVKRETLLFYIFALAGTGILAVPLLLIQKRYLPNLDANLIFVLMGAGLLATAALLYSQRGKVRNRPGAEAGWLDGLMTGLMQGLSVIPGVSRSGSATSALVWRGFDPASTFELAFILSIPTVLIAEVIFNYALGAAGGSFPAMDGLALASCSFVVGFLTIDALLRVARKVDLSLVAAVFGLLMIAAGLMQIS